MKKNKFNFGKQAVIWSIGLVTLFFAQWLISIILVRVSGFQISGIFVLAMTISNVFAYFGNYGMRSYQVTDEKQTYTDAQYLFARFVTISLSIFFCFIYLNVAGNYNQLEKKAIILYLFYSSVNTVSDSLQGSIQNCRHLEIAGVSNIIRGILCFLFFLLLYYSTYNLLFALMAMITASLIVTIIFDYHFYKVLVPRISAYPQVSNNSIFRLLLDCAPLMLSQTFPIMTTAIPRRAIQIYSGAENLGVYSSIFAPTVVITVLIPSFVTAVLPHISKQFEIKPESIYKWILYGMILIIILCSLGCIGVRIVGKPLLMFMYGDSIKSFSNLLYWAVLISILNGTISYFNGILTVTRKLRIIGALSFITLLITGMTSYPIIRLFGIYGAAQLQFVILSMQTILEIVFCYVKEKF